MALPRVRFIGFLDPLVRCEGGTFLKLGNLERSLTGDNGFTGALLAPDSEISPESGVVERVVGAISVLAVNAWRRYKSTREFFSSHSFRITIPLCLDGFLTSKAYSPETGGKIFFDMPKCQGFAMSENDIDGDTPAVQTSVTVLWTRLARKVDEGRGNP